MNIKMANIVLLGICFLFLSDVNWSTAAIKETRPEAQDNYEELLDENFKRKEIFVKPNTRDYKLEEEQSCGGYQIQIYKGEKVAGEFLRILYSGSEIYYEEGNKFRIGLVYDEVPQDQLVRCCKDITGSGEP